jgi:hypothetical protein
MIHFVPIMIDMVVVHGKEKDCVVFIRIMTKIATVHHG